MISQKKRGMKLKLATGKDSDKNEVFHYQMDILWWYLSNLTKSGTNVLRFKHLIKVAEIVWVVPHSNLELERLFSIVKKTDGRSSLKLNDTLSNILNVKFQLRE